MNGWVIGVGASLIMIIIISMHGMGIVGMDLWIGQVNKQTDGQTDTGLLLNALFNVGGYYSIIFGR